MPAHVLAIIRYEQYLSHIQKHQYITKVIEMAFVCHV